MKRAIAFGTVAASPTGLSRLRRLRGVASTIAGALHLRQRFPTALSAGGNTGGSDVNRSAARAPNCIDRAARSVGSGRERGRRSARKAPTRRPPSAYIAHALTDLRGLAIGMAAAFTILGLMRGTL